MGIAGIKNSFKKCDDVKKKIVLKKGVKGQNVIFFRLE